MRKNRHLVFVFSMLLSFAYTEAREPSTCYGTTSNGRLENGWNLPASGANFQSYSAMARLLGRTYVHSWVHSVVLETYAVVETSLPDTVFVYGETGKKKGGAFEPHKTHKNGLSVDFMVPVRNTEGDSVPLPTNILNKWGYDLEFDAEGRLDNLTIDFDAIAEHIYQLHQKAKESDGDIWRVIFAPELQPYLHDSPRWPYLEANMQFSTKRSWVRHDEHYHVDFVVSCEPAT